MSGVKRLAQAMQYATKTRGPVKVVSKLRGKKADKAADAGRAAPKPSKDKFVRELKGNRAKRSSAMKKILDAQK